MNSLQHYVNHVVFVVDKSSSMEHLSTKVVKIFDNQIKYLSQRSQELNQETRVSVYLFNDYTKCLVYDMDVMRLPSLSKHYNTSGSTALIDATLKSINDLRKTPELYDDHAFLLYVLTDGEENRSMNAPSTLKKTLSNLSNNWTVAALVPNKSGVEYCVNFGFLRNNVQIWETSEKGLEDVSKVITQSSDMFMTNRSKGIRSTSSLFTVDTFHLSQKNLKSKLTELPANSYQLFSVHKENNIKDFVESWTKQSYIKGSAYYWLTKPEQVQPYKQVCIQNKMNGKVYGGTQARKLLGLPSHEVKVTPANYGDYDIFVQSTSVNRKLPSGTKVLVLN